MRRFKLLHLLLWSVCVTFCQIPQSRAAETAPLGEGLEGLWSGVMNIGPGKLKIVFQFSKKADGTLQGKLHSIDQGAIGMAVDEVTFKDDELKLQVKSIGGSYKGKLSPDGTKLVGQWTQGGQSLPFNVQHVAEVPELVRPQDPKKPYPYVEEEVTYANQQAGVKIAGTLTHPEGDGPFPTVIIVPEGNRDGESAGHHPFLVLADYLTRRGLAVLRTDDRGDGSSTGDGNKETSGDRMADVLAGIEYLKTRKEVAAKRIGLIGYQQGGVAATLCAAQSKDVAFLVLMAAPGINGQQLMGLQAMTLPQAYGQGKGAGLQSLNAQAEIFDILAEEHPPAETEKRLRDVVRPLIEAALPKPAKPGPQADAMKAMAKEITDQQVGVMMKPEFRFYLKYDPQATLRKVQCPVLAINGELDPMMPARQNLQGIETALKAGGNVDFTVKSLLKINHIFQTAETNSVTDSAKIKETLAPSVLKLVGDWIKQRVD